jgi:hypothetical protein
VEQSILKGISDRRGDFALPGKKISDPHNEVDVLHSRWAPEGTGTAGGAGPQFRLFKKRGRVICIGCLSNKSPHIERRPEFDRTSTCASSALDAEI